MGSDHSEIFETDRLFSKKKSYVTGNLKEAVKFWKEKKVRQKGITYNAAMDTGYT